MRLVKPLAEVFTPLERKLPLLIAGLLCAVVAAFGWMAHEALERSFETAAADRREAAKSAGGQPRSSEQVASRSGISTRLSGDRILAVSPMKRTPATTRVLLGWSRPKRAISSESATQPPLSSARSCRSPST